MAGARNIRTVQALSSPTGTQYLDENGNVRLSRVAGSFTATVEDVVLVTDLTAARTVTIPPAGNFPPGQLLWIKDGSGAAGFPNNLVVQVAGINPSVDVIVVRATARVGANQCNEITAAALPACTAAGTGVGKTLTGNVNGALTVDSVAVSTNDTVLVKNQVNAADNGVYTVTQTGDATHVWILTRHTSWDEATELLRGSTFVALAGTVNTGLSFAFVGGIDDQPSISCKTPWGTTLLVSTGVDWHQLKLGA